MAALISDSLSSSTLRNPDRPKRFVNPDLLAHSRIRIVIIIFEEISNCLFLPRLRICRRDEQRIRQWELFLNVAEGFFASFFDRF